MTLQCSTHFLSTIHTQIIVFSFLISGSLWLAGGPDRKIVPPVDTHNQQQRPKIKTSHFFQAGYNLIDGRYLWQIGAQRGNVESRGEKNHIVAQDKKTKSAVTLKKEADEEMRSKLSAVESFQAQFFFIFHFFLYTWCHRLTSSQHTLALASEWHICLTLQTVSCVFSVCLYHSCFGLEIEQQQLRDLSFLCSGRWCTVFMLWIKTLSWTLCQLQLAVYSHALVPCLLVLSDFLYQHILCKWSTEATLAPMGDTFVGTYHYRWFLLLVGEKRFLMFAVVSNDANNTFVSKESESEASWKLSTIQEKLHQEHPRGHVMWHDYPPVLHTHHHIKVNLAGSTSLSSFILWWPGATSSVRPSRITSSITH